MNELAKWAWISFLAIIYLGYWFFVLLALEILVIALIAWLKPEWLKRKY